MSSGRMEYDPTNGQYWYDPYAIEKEFYWQGWTHAQEGKPMLTDISGEIECCAYQRGYAECKSRLARGLPVPIERYPRCNQLHREADSKSQQS